LSVLLDTHAFLWWCAGSPELSKKAQTTIAAEECFVSLASFWEIAIKLNLGKLRLPGNPQKYIADQMAANGFAQLDISYRHVMRCASMEPHHRDPFDRLLVAQTQEESLTLISRNPFFDSYGIQRVW
jgi:PIN domain nuclease of toxin-antitoxin system